MILLFLGTLLTCLVTYWWYNVITTRYKLQWIPKAPGLPFLGNILDFQDSRYFIQAFEKHTKNIGGVYRLEGFTKTGIIVSDYDFVEYLLTTTKILDKALVYNFLDRWLGTGLLTAPGSKWKTTRKILTPAFHFSILEQFVDVFESNGNELIEILGEQLSNPYIDIYPFINMCALNIICEAAMGVSINAQREAKSDYVHAVREMCRIAVDRAKNVLSLFELTYPLTMDYYKERKYVKILHTYTNSVIESKLATLNAKKDANKSDSDDVIGIKKKKAFLDLLLESNQNGGPLSKSDIREEVDTFMFAGHDTTTTAISFALYVLAKHTDIQNKVVEEQKILFGSNRNINASYRDLQDMKYLELVIKETLRLYPPVPFIGRKTDTEVEYQKGKFIPRGLDILIFIYGINRNPKYFKNPDEFDPSRFENMDKHLPFAYVPFSAGPRNCIGQKFAMLEAKSVISKILRHFELQLPEDNLKPTIISEVVLKSLNGINIKLKRRPWT